MYKVEIYNHETKKTIGTLDFETKEEANKFIKDTAEKRGCDFILKNDRSIKYNKLY
mgnify:CR=1 FL=1